MRGPAAFRGTTKRGACGAGAAGVEAIVARAGDAGWAENTAEVGEALARLLAVTQTMMLAGEGAHLMVRGEGASQLHLLVANAANGPARVGCFVLAQNDAAGVPQAAISEWLGEAPSAARDLSAEGGPVMVRWDHPDGVAGALGVAVIHLPPGSTGAEQLGASGTMFAMVSAPAPQ